MIDIIKIYQKYNIKYHTKGKNCHKGWVNIQCPFCDDSTNHLGFEIKKQRYKCWKCGHKWNYQVFKALKIPTDELNNHSVIQTKIIDNLKIKKKEFKLPGNTELNNQAKKYIINRGYNLNHIINKYKIRSCNYSDNIYKYRIIIPIFYNENLISFTSRDYTNKSKLRYLSCPKEMEIIKHKKILYNVDNCKEDYIIVVEGIFDCWKIGDNCCATFGISYTREQISLLTEYKRIFIIFDNEKEAQKAAENLGDILSGIGKEVYIINIPIIYNDIAEMKEPDIIKLKERINKLC